MSDPGADLEVFKSLRPLAEGADREAMWPVASWEILGKGGVLAWSIPAEFGGRGLSTLDQMRGNEVLASNCLTTAFLLSQREAAIRWILKGPKKSQQKYLPDAARGLGYLTIGISQITTSRQHCAPSLLAKSVDGGFQIDGVIPWVTGGVGAQAVVAGAVISNDKTGGEQILFVLPLEAPGVTVGPPMPLSALAGSCTSEIRCDGVFLSREDLLAGPGHQLLGKMGGGGLETSCLALGLAGAAIDWLGVEAQTRPEVLPVFQHFDRIRADSRGILREMVASAPSPEDALKFRAGCTRTALQCTQAALLLSKGSGFVAPHPVQRWARQALFFLVWSCPRPVADDVLHGFLGNNE